MLLSISWLLPLCFHFAYCEFTRIISHPCSIDCLSVTSSSACMQCAIYQQRKRPPACIRSFINVFVARWYAGHVANAFNCTHISTASYMGKYSTVQRDVLLLILVAYRVFHSVRVLSCGMECGRLRLSATINPRATLIR